MTDQRRAGEVVCFGDQRKPHVLARVTSNVGSPLTLEPAPGVKWTAVESTGGASVNFQCRHGHSRVDLFELAREIRSTTRRIRRSVNGQRPVR